MRERVSNAALMSKYNERITTLESVLNDIKYCIKNNRSLEDLKVIITLNLQQSKQLYKTILDSLNIK